MHSELLASKLHLEHLGVAETNAHNSSALAEALHNATGTVAERYDH